jgi:hypothetical protein
MHRTDKFLLSIVAGIVLLVAAGFALMLLRPKPGYLADDTPAGVANNYLLALQREDYERAYRYLSPELPGYPPDAATFGEYAGSGYGGGDSVSVEVIDVSQSGDHATVSFLQTAFYEGGLFSSGSYENEFQMQLVRANGQWWVEHSDYYWGWCFDQAEGCL